MTHKVEFCNFRAKSVLRVFSSKEDQTNQTQGSPLRRCDFCRRAARNGFIQLLKETAQLWWKKKYTEKPEHAHDEILNSCKFKNSWEQHRFKMLPNMFQHADWGSRGSNHQPSAWQKAHFTSWATAASKAVPSLYLYSNVCAYINLPAINWLYACFSHRRRVVLVSSGANHPTKNFQSIDADVSCCIDGRLRDHLAVNEHFGACLTDCNVKLHRNKKITQSLLSSWFHWVVVLQILMQKSASIKINKESFLCLAANQDVIILISWIYIMASLLTTSAVFRSSADCYVYRRWENSAPFLSEAVK